MKCDRCQVEPGLRCPGEHARRLCHLAATRPGYAATVRDHARQQAESPDAIIARVEAARRAYEALPPSERKGCCG